MRYRLYGDPCGGRRGRGNHLRDQIPEARKSQRDKNSSLSVVSQRHCRPRTELSRYTVLLELVLQEHRMGVYRQGARARSRMGNDEVERGVLVDGWVGDREDSIYWRVVYG